VTQKKSVGGKGGGCEVVRRSGAGKKPKRTREGAAVPTNAKKSRTAGRWEKSFVETQPSAEQKTEAEKKRLHHPAGFKKGKKATGLKAA